MSAASPTTSSSTTPRDQQFCLRWNNYQSNLTQVFNQLFQSESFVDVTLACEGNSVKAHRMVLAACSPYFQNVLNQTPCSHPVIILQGVKWTELKAVVEFMYKGQINVCQEQLGPLLRVAESLKIRGLTDVGGEDGEAVITSPTGSPRSTSQFWSEEAPRKRRRRSTDEPRSRSRTPTPGSNTPVSINAAAAAAEGLDASLNTELANTLSRGSAASSTSNPAVPSPVASLASSLSSFAHFHTPMPPPGPPLPPHLAHLPPLSPLSPLLNMHPLNRHHSPEDFEIRPGIAEMIREEERAKLIESTHHWMSNPMADSYQAQVQAAWQKSWNQTQSLLQNLRFRERGPLKSWRPETMADAIHAVLKEGLSLSQAARKFDIPYPTFVLYANRVHNLLGPSHEPGDMRPKGRGRPQRILLGSWPEDQIKGVIRAVVFRDTTVFRDNDHKENKKPTVPQIKNEVVNNGGAFPTKASDSNSGPATPVPPTPSTSQPLPPGGIMPPLTTPPNPGHVIQIPKLENGAETPEIASSTTSSTPTHLSQSRPTSASSNGHSPKLNGTSSPIPSEGPKQSFPPVQTRLPAPGSQQQQQMLGLLSGGLSPTSHMARLFSDPSYPNNRGAAPPAPAAPPVNSSFSSLGGFPRVPMQANFGLNGLMNSLGQQPQQQQHVEEPEPSPEALLFGKIASERQPNFLTSENMRVAPFPAGVNAPPGNLERPLMFRDGLDTIKTEPEAIMN